MLYRFVYHNVLNDPVDVVALGDLVQFMLGTFLLYLRVSGQFHLIVGLLHLFGFRLPETHKLYYLAHSFTELWRRINIYWTDFMMKTVFYPTYFQVKRLGPSTRAGALDLGGVRHDLDSALLSVVLAAGRVSDDVQDALFWGFLGALVVIGALKELKAVRKTKRAGRWLELEARSPGGRHVLLLLLPLVAVEHRVGGAVGLDAGRRRRTSTRRASSCSAPRSASSWSSAGATGSAARRDVAAWMACGSRRSAGARPSPRCSCCSWSSASRRFRRAMPEPRCRRACTRCRPPGSTHATPPSSTAATTSSSTCAAQLNDAASPNARATATASGGTTWRASASCASGAICSSATSIRRKQRALERQQFSTNGWGMRDRDYAQRKPAGTLRIALLGPSHVMGNGVADGADLRSARRRPAEPRVPARSLSSSSRF